MEKQYLYHGVPKKLHGENLVPLNILKKENIDAYLKEVKKYTGREEIMERPIPGIEGSTWSDVIFFSAIHPNDLYRALREGMIKAKIDPKEIEEKIKLYEDMEFYQIDPDILEPDQTVILLDPRNKDEFLKYDASILNEHSIVPESTIEYYAEQFAQGEHPLLFLGIPHIVHAGTIPNIKDFPVIAIDKTKPVS